MISISISIAPESCCERYGTNDDGVGRWLATAVGLLIMYVGLRLLSNENASIIKPSSDEEGGTP